MRFLTISLLSLLAANISQAIADDAVSPRIAWYGTLQSGFDAAKRSGRPILFVSAAPQCLGVSGIW